MAKYSENAKDPYLDASGVLKNRLGIKDQEQLDKIEATFAAIRSAELVNKPVAGKFDLNHLKETHKRLFGDVYEWAGEIRQVDISKGSSRFANSAMIESFGKDVFRQLGKENQLRGLDADEFSKRLGYHLGEINAMHPFREGNGRTQREFGSELARENGYQISWDQMKREDLNRAFIESFNGDPGRLSHMIRQNLTDLDHEKAANMARTYAGDRVQIERAEDGKSYQGKVIGATERYVVQERTDRAGEVVLHNRRALSADAEKIQGREVEIRYPHGSAGLVKDVQRQAEAGPQKEAVRDRAASHQGQERER